MMAAPRVPPDVPGWTTGLARATSVELDKAVGLRAGRWLLIAPLGLWIITGAVVSLHGLQPWLTPFSAAGVLLSGYMDAQRWAQVGVVVLVWVVALNVAGMLRLHRLTRASAMSAHVG
ncbi:MAG TPA: hypothetical protein VI094_19010 [Propionibacteriaceae bacterium]